MPVRVLLAILVAGLAAVLAVVPALAQKGKKTFSETTDVVVVEVPVTVVRDGEPVRDLTAQNFRIVDGGKEQELVGFEVIDLSKLDGPLTTIAEQREVPVAARRHFLMFFDMAFSQPESLVRARWAARDLIDSLHPTDLAGVAIYTSTQGANLILGFTSDRRQLELAIQTLGVPELTERAPDPLGLVLGDIRAFDRAQADIAGGGVDSPQGGVARDRSDIEAILDEQVNEAIGRIAAAERSANVNKIAALTGNMESLAQLLASLDGRKHVVYFSEGIPTDVLLGEERTQETQASIESGEIWNVDTDRFGSTQSQNQLEGMIESFRRAGCIIQSVDIGGLRAEGAVGQRGAGDDAMLAMAKDTGGEFFENFNDLGVAMEKMLDRTSVTYLLAFQPKKLSLDGKYHRLKVDLENGPRGARLSHRAGYYAPLPSDQVDARRRQLSTAELIMSDDEGGAIGLDLLAMPFPVAGQKAYAPVLLEVDGGDLLAGGKTGQLQLEIYAYATDGEGRVADFFAQSLGMDLAQVGPLLAQTGLKYWGHFDLAPGRYTARVMVRDSRDGRYSLARRTFDVPAFDQSEAAVLPPMFPEPPGKWVLIREPETRQRDVPYPFMAAGQPYIPAVKPAVPAKGSAPVYLSGIDLGPAADLTAQVLDAAGAPVKGVELKLDAPTADGAMQTAVAELQTRGLAPGEYTLVSTATDASGSQRSNAIHFVVR